ncbi:hypothetical protein EJ110_NYTH11298 [Nymphaea thermarum]|nr:hypothetical protein EJ110_NYTH11298 [Nymphaea thermarum]
MEADSMYYQEKKDVEAQLYKREPEGHIRSVVAEMRNRQHEADAESRKRLRIIIKRAVSGVSQDRTSETTGRFGPERLRPELLSKMTVELETKMMEADSMYYQEKKDTEAHLYKRELEAHGRSAVAEMRNRQQDAELYAKQKASEVMVEAANAEAYYVDEMLTALGGNYMAQRDYLMINE